MPFWKMRETLKDGSAYEVSEEQLAAVEAWKQNRRSGFIVLPCGSGKTLVAIMLAIEAGRRVLFLTPGNVNKQFEENIKKFTTVEEEYIYVLNSTSKGKKGQDHNALQEWLITTHQMFSGNRSRAEKGLERMQYVHNEPWDLVIFDEGQHSEAPTYKRFLENFIKRGITVVALTGTKFHRNADAFNYIGPNIFEVTMKKLENEGSIAKLNVIQVNVPTDDVTSKAVALSNRYKGGIISQHIACTSPNHIDAIRKIVYMHRNNVNKHKSLCIVYAAYKVTAEMYHKELNSMPNQRWALYTSSDKQGGERSQNATLQTIVDDFRAGTYDGIVSTQIGNEGLDVTHDCFDLVINACGNKSPVSIIQRIGRVQRTKRIMREESETDEQYLVRKLAKQKQAYVYELATDIPEFRAYSQARMNTVREHGFEVQEVDFQTDICDAADVRRATHAKDMQALIDILEKEIPQKRKDLQTLVDKRDAAQGKLHTDDTETACFRLVQSANKRIIIQRTHLREAESKLKVLLSDRKYQDAWCESPYKTNYERMDLLVRCCIGIKKREHVKAARNETKKASSEKRDSPISKPTSKLQSLRTKSKKKKSVTTTTKEDVEVAEQAAAMVTDDVLVRAVCASMNVPKELMDKYNIKWDTDDGKEDKKRKPQVAQARCLKKQCTDDSSDDEQQGPISSKQKGKKPLKVPAKKPDDSSDSE